MAASHSWRQQWQLLISVYDSQLESSTLDLTPLLKPWPWLTLIHPVSNWTHWATLRRHPCLCQELPTLLPRRWTPSVVDICWLHSSSSLLVDLVLSCILVPASTVLVVHMENCWKVTIKSIDLYNYLGDPLKASVSGDNTSLPVRWYSQYLVVAGDDDDTDASFTAVLYRINHLDTRRVQHSNDSDKRTVRLRNKRQNVTDTFQRSQTIPVSTFAICLLPIYLFAAIR